MTPPVPVATPQPPPPKPATSKPPAHAQAAFPPLRLAGKPAAAFPPLRLAGTPQHNGATASAAAAGVRPPPTPEAIRAAQPHLAEIQRLEPVEVARAHRQLNAPPGPDDRVGVDMQRAHYDLPSAVAEVLRPAALARKEAVFAAFAADRNTLQEAMVATTTGGDRHDATEKLRTYDAPHLALLRAMRAELGGWWDIADDVSRKAVIAALQLEAMTTALTELRETSSRVHKRVADAAGHPLNEQWCGMFAGDEFVRSNLDKDLRPGFMSVDNVEDYFRYNYARDRERIRPWIWIDGGWEHLEAYHAARGSQRTWMKQSQVQQGGNLDIRPGDVVLIDRLAKGTPNHIVIAASYDPVTSTLVTIGGNDGGYVLGTPSPGLLRQEERNATPSMRQEAEAHLDLPLKPGPGADVAVKALSVRPEAGKKFGHVFGVGRPSIVDFEDHRYPTAAQMAKLPLAKPPPPLKQ